MVLKPASLAFTPREFYVADVVDERRDRSAVAWLLVPPAKPGTTATSATKPLDLQGGGAAALRQFVRQSLPRNPALRPVVVRVQECRIVEMPGPNGTAQGRVEVVLAFDWKHEGRTIPLTTYRGGARYARLAHDPTVVEPTLRQALADALRYLNGWMNNAAAHDIRLATAVRPVIRDDVRQNEPDTLFYSPARPLVWSDFTGQPRTVGGRYAAAVFPGFSYRGQPRLVNGVVVLDLAVQVFVVRSSSWVAPGQQTPENLNHEQRHFDIVKLVAERFKRKAHPDSLTVEDYNSILQLQYLKSFSEMNRLQEQYDAETHTGNSAMQERWNRRIDAELKGYGVK